MDKIEKKYTEAKECPITLFMTHIGGKWKPVIIWLLLSKPTMRFSELDKAIQGISQKMLTQQLRDLEQEGFVIRTSYPVIPPKVEYHLSEKGQSLRPLLTLIMQWSNQYLVP